MSDHEDDDEVSSSQHESSLRTTMALRLHADNLPRHGLRRNLPDTYAVVTSVSGRTSKSGPIDHVATVGQDHVLSKAEWGRTEM